MVKTCRLIMVSFALLGLVSLASCMLFSKMSAEEKAVRSALDGAGKAVDDFGKALKDLAERITDAREAENVDDILPDVGRLNVETGRLAKAAEDNVAAARSRVDGAKDSPQKTLQLGEIGKIEIRLRKFQAKAVEVQTEAAKLLR